MSNDQTHDQQEHDEFEQNIAGFPDPAEFANFVDTFDYKNFDMEMFGCEDTTVFDDQQIAMVAASLRDQNGFEATLDLDPSRARLENVPVQSRGSHAEQTTSRQSDDLHFDMLAGTYLSTVDTYHMPAIQSQQQMQQMSTSNAAVPTEPIAGLHFANRAEAQQAFAQRKVAWTWKAPQPDFTMPLIQQDREKYILQLLAAFKDTSTCQDSGTAISYEERWANLAAGQSTYTPQQLETVCWKLLETALKIHSHGPASLRIFDDGKLKTVHMSRKLNFAARIQLVCDLLRLSKSRCETLLAFDDVEMTVGAPAQMIAMAKTNKKQNRKRQGQLIKGREVLKGKDGKAGRKEVGEEGKTVPVQGLQAAFVPPQAPIVQATTYSQAASNHVSLQHQPYIMGEAHGYQDPGRGFSGHGVQPGLLPAAHRYPIQPTVTSGLGAGRHLPVGAQPSGKNRRGYSEYDESQDDSQPYANKRVR
jgi:hypothetical protein